AYAGLLHRAGKHRTPTPVSCIVQEGIVRLRRSPASCRKVSYAYAGLLHRAGRYRMPMPVSCIVQEARNGLRSFFYISAWAVATAEREDTDTSTI
ncbi:hypothetical protein, partial [Porphyromonas loveana]|uniref:hypothetical protein n=1 Tax=Porphyromonas loveana TaxID=1884669 RepID=UPI0035A1AD49